MDYNSLFARNLDSYGLIVQVDGGDTATNVFAALYSAPYSRENLLNALSWLVVNGVVRRHPNPEKWYSRPNTTSRDQLIPYLCFVSTPNSVDKELVRAYFFELAKQHSKHLFLFTWNTRRNHVYPTLEEHLARSTPDVKWNYRWKLPDICGPDLWSIYLRGLVKHTKLGKALLPIIYPLLCTLDVYCLADNLLFATLWALGSRPGPTYVKKAIDHDKKNAMLVTHYCAKNIPTPLSALAWALNKAKYLVAARSFYSQANEPRLDAALEQLLE